MASNHVLSFDIGSGGMSAALFNENLDVSAYNEVSWEAPLSAATIIAAFQELARSASATQGDNPIRAIAISSFMHSFVVLGWDGNVQSPVYTWMDDAAPAGIDAIRNAIGSEFHQRTGCRYHPMFPVFKLASMKLAKGDRIASPKTLLLESLTGKFVEDFGMGSASGMFNVQSADWDDEILRAANLFRASLPQLMDPHATVGRIQADTVVVNGSGDGFAANVGSGCEASNRMAITVGTSAAVRQMVAVPALNLSAGTFCYRATSGDAFLLGCASSNGGNVLDWARREFGVHDAEGASKRDLPIFLPWLNGERSLEWNPGLRAEWHGRSSNHHPKDLFRAVREGVAFNLAQYVEIIEKSSAIRARQVVLSGNGFLDPVLAPTLAALVSRETLQPESSGLGTLRGTAVYAWRALGHDATPAIEQLLDRAERVVPVDDDYLLERYDRFKQLRAKSASEAA